MSAPQRCLICKTKSSDRHWFYPALCVSCGEFNYAKRQETADLQGAIALITGARIKIGYAVALRLLRSGALVVATTRFPHDAARRYNREPDFHCWSDRLQIYPLDLRDLGQVEYFTQHLRATYPRLDIIINNAAQTVRRPPEFYQHLREFESVPVESLPASLQPLLTRSHSGYCYHSQSLPNPAQLSSDRPGFPLSKLPSPSFSETEEKFPDRGDGFPLGHYDEFGQQLDLRPFNSWLMKDEEVSIWELLEVHAINAIAPFILNSRLKPLMKQFSDRPKFIINVSSMEGRFEGNSKSWRHPHTNMAKASLNQMTRTCASEYAKSRIYMNGVDPGWISFQHPHRQVMEMQARGVTPPFDITDAAARICDPIYLGVNRGIYPFGKLFKDYVESAW